MLEIFGHFGPVKNVERREQMQQRGAYVEFEKHEDLEKAIQCMNKGEKIFSKIEPFLGIVTEIQFPFFRSN